jgi:hypothetical protein
MRSGSSTANVIVDARPLVNAVSNRALGAGTESLENYKQCQRLFMGIENIHVMRDSLYRLYDAVLATPDPGMDRWLSSLESSSWSKHLKCIMDATVIIIQTILAGGNVLIHCRYVDPTMYMANFTCHIYKVMDGTERPSLVH